MNPLSLLSFLAFLAYVFLGALALRRNYRSHLNRVFALLCGTLALWSFGFAFLYVAPNPEFCLFWDRIASVGWSFFAAVTLHFVLVLTGREKLLRRPWVLAALYLPGIAIFVKYLTSSLGGDIEYIQRSLGWSPWFKSEEWFWGFEAYTIGFSSLSLLLITRWMVEAGTLRERRQAGIVFLSGIMSFAAGAGIDIVRPLLIKDDLPPVAPIVGLVWAAGIWYAMVRQGFMTLTPSTASDQIFSGVPDLLLLVEPDGTIADANAKAIETIGTSREELLGRPLDGLFESPEQAPKALAAITDLKGTPALPIEVRWKTKDGRIVEVWLSGSGIRSQAGTTIGTLLVARDTAEHRRMEEELARVSSVDSIGILAGGIAHDFNNLLTVIIGNLQLVRASKAEDDRTDQRLSEAERAADQARLLAGRLLSLSRGGEPEREPVSPEKLISEAASVALMGSDVRLKIDLPADLRSVSVDPGQLNQVLHNLLINSQQAMPGGGTITIEGAEHTVPGVLLPGRPSLDKGGYIRLSVRDEGSGILEGDMEQVFEPFFSTKSSGSGLGLSSSRSIVHRHGGAIGVESESGKGTTFHVYLPVADRT